MPLYVQKNGEDFPGQKSQCVCSAVVIPNTRWSISAVHAWWWWKMAWHSVSIKTSQHTAQPTNTPLQDFAEFGQIFPELPQLLMVRVRRRLDRLWVRTGALDPPLRNSTHLPDCRRHSPGAEQSQRSADESVEFDTPSKQGDTGSELVSKIRNTGSDLCMRRGGGLRPCCKRLGKGTAKSISLVGSTDPSPVRWSLSFAALLETEQRWHGADLPLPGGRRIVSVSPESFLVRRGDQLLTRPIRGRPAMVIPMNCSTA